MTQFHASLHAQHLLLRYFGRLHTRMLLENALHNASVVSVGLYEDLGLAELFS